jgi:hypothetical protein
MNRALRLALMRSLEAGREVDQVADDQHRLVEAMKKPGEIPVKCTVIKSAAPSCLSPRDSPAGAEASAFGLASIRPNGKRDAPQQGTRRAL